MMISGVVVACRPEHLSAVTDGINALPWAEVHHTDPQGRLVVTVEASDADASIDCVRKLQDLPHVSMAEMAQYCVDEEP